MTTQTHRRARHSVTLRHAHLVFVTTYPRPVCTDAMLTFAENTMDGACLDPDAELVEFNGEADHVHLLVANPTHTGDRHPGSATQRPYRFRGAPPLHRHLPPCPHARTPVIAVLLRRVLRWRATVDHQAIHRRPSPGTLNAGLPPSTTSNGLTPD